MSDYDWVQDHPEASPWWETLLHIAGLVALFGSVLLAVV